MSNTRSFVLALLLVAGLPSCQEPPEPQVDRPSTTGGEAHFHVNDGEGNVMHRSVARAERTEPAPRQPDGTMYDGEGNQIRRGSSEYEPPGAPYTAPSAKQD